MTYGLSPSLFIEDGPAVQAQQVQAARPSARWRTLDAEHRLALIERALQPANDRFDNYPLAL